MYFLYKQRPVYINLHICILKYQWLLPQTLAIHLDVICCDNKLATNPIAFSKGLIYITLYARAPP